MNRPMWDRYALEMRFEGRLMGGIPKHPDVIKSWLEVRMPTYAPPDAIPLDDLAAQVAIAANATEAEENKVWTGFMSDPVRGLYIPGFHLKAHLKDVANVAKELLDIRNLKAKLADRLFVDEKELWLKLVNRLLADDKQVWEKLRDNLVVVEPVLWLNAQAPTGYWEHAVHVMTMQGPRSALKRTDYVERPVLTAHIRVLADGVITEAVLRQLFEFGGTKGFGAERGLGNGRYQAILTVLEP